MNRAFISLYVIIVLSVVILGLMLNKMWDSLYPNDELSTAYKPQILQLNDFAQTASFANLRAGKIVLASNEQQQVYYQRVGDSQQVLALSVDNRHPHKNLLYIGFILLFYGAIAIAVFLWVWPLTRDLSRLGEHTQKLGANMPMTQVQISPRSVLYPFAHRYNTMARRLDEIMRSYQEMTYAVSHELRTPLARMKFAVAMLESPEATPQARASIAGLVQDITEMEGLINSLLTYAGFESQTRQLHQREGKLADLITGVVERFQAGAPSYMRITLNDQMTGVLCRCEWSLMQIAVQNLMANAVSYASEYIMVSLHSDQQGFAIWVDDDGPGVPQEARERIFDSFIRLRSESDSHPGFGLGLAIVKRIMGWHSGDVRCELSPLGGARFILRWPRQEGGAP